jgi:hypothetical protein
MSQLSRRVLTWGLAACSFGLVLASARADDYGIQEKSITCASQDGRRSEGKRGVWVDEGCRAKFLFTRAWGGDSRRN